LFIPVHSSSVKGLSGGILDKYFTDNFECLTICIQSHSSFTRIGQGRGFPACPVYWCQWEWKL